MPIKNLPENKVFIPNNEMYVFPDKCVYCLSTSHTKIDYPISHSFQKLELTRSIKYFLSMTIKGVPYCKKHTEHSKQLNKILWIIGIISMIVGVIGSALFNYFESSMKTAEIGVIIFSFILITVLIGIVIFLLLRTALLVKYPNIWKLGADTGMLGFKSNIISSTDRMGNPVVEGALLKFGNKAYKKLFLEVNGVPIQKNSD